MHRLQTDLELSCVSSVGDMHTTSAMGGAHAIGTGSEFAHSQHYCFIQSGKPMIVVIAEATQRIEFASAATREHLHAQSTIHFNRLHTMFDCQGSHYAMDVRR